MMRVRITQTLVKTLASLAILLAAVATTPVAQADGYRDYCEQQARRLSGYNGKASDIVGGAIKGAIGAAIISGIFGGNKKDRKNAARTGAVLGGIGGALRKNSRAARIYQLEFEDCMRRR